MKKLMLILTFTLTGLMITVNAFTKTIVTDGLVGYWTFDQNAIKNNIVQDAWGKNDAMIAGNPIITAGTVKRGIRLDGIGDYVILPNVGNFGRRIGAYTFEAWFKTTRTNSWSAIYKVMEPPCNRENNGYGILINAAYDAWNNIIETKKDSFHTQRANKVGEGGCTSSSSTGILPVSDGKWHQIVYTTRTPTDEELAELPFRIPLGVCSTIAIYLDAQLYGDSTGCTSGPLRPYTEPIYLGAVNDDGKALGFFDGVFDEVRIYDRALTHKEVKRNYDLVLSVEAGQKLSTVWGSLKARH